MRNGTCKRGLARGLLCAAIALAIPASAQLENTKIAFVSDREESRRKVFVMDPDGATPTPRTDPGPDDANDVKPDWSPDGTKLAFTRVFPAARDIFTVNAADGSNPVNLTGGEGVNFTPAWSPDGTQIAFASDRGSGEEVYVMNAADGTGAAPLTDSAGVNHEPTWSPDGSQIAFVSTRDGDYSLYIMNADGSAQTRVVPSGSIGNVIAHPDWSPDGAKILFILGNVITVSSSDGAAVTPITPQPPIAGQLAHARWSTDGTTIAFSVGSGGVEEVYTMLADGSNAAPITAAGGLNNDASWSPFLISPDIVVTPTSLSFNSVILNGQATDTFTITSTGTATLTVSDITSDNAAFTVAPDTQTLPFDLLAADPDLFETVTVTFTPTVEGLQSANITVIHNAADSPTVVTATGTGVPPAPTVTVTAPTAGQELPAGTTSTPITVAITDHPAPGHWHWQLDTPFADSGAATGTEVPAGTFTDTIPNLVDEQTYTVYAALVDDATTGDALVDAIAYPTSRASVTFSVATGGTPTDAVTVVDSQGSAGDVVTVPITIFDVATAAEVVSGIDLTVTYDPALLTPTADGTGAITAAAVGPVVPVEWSLEQNVITPGELEIVLAGSFDFPLTGAGSLVQVAFTVDAAAVTNTTSPIGLSRARLNDGNVASTPVGGTFTVVNLMYGDVTGNGDWGGYDAAHVLEHVARELATGTHHTFLVEVTAPVWAPLPLTHAVAETVANVGGETKPDPLGGVNPVPDIDALDASMVLQRAVSLITVFPVETASAPAATPIAVVAPLSASSTSERPGALVTITLDTSAIRGLRAGELVLEFDGTLLRPVQVSLRRGGADDGAQAPLLAQREGDGRLAVAFASARPIGSDAALEVTFEADRDIAQPRESAVRASHLRLNGSRMATDFSYFFRVEPFQTRLMANYPNPFNPETWIPFELAADADVTIRVYGLDGALVRELPLGHRAIGEHVDRGSAAYWDGANASGEQVSSGVYVYELTAGDTRALRRMVVRK